MKEITSILCAIERGDAHAVEALLPIVYDELRRVAAVQLRREAPGQTLQATALVHEAYIRLFGNDKANWNNRGHFFAAAAKAMRRILVDQARRRLARKRGGGQPRISLDAAELPIDSLPQDILDLDEALNRLAAEDPVKAELVNLRFFAGLSREQTARHLGIPITTGDRYWAYARAWLYRELRGGTQ